MRTLRLSTVAAVQDRQGSGLCGTWRDPEVVKRLLTTPATWAVIGLSANTERTAYSIGQYLHDRLGTSIVPVNLRGEDALGARDIAGWLRSPARSRSWTPL
jgi:hypothetical protein